MHTCLIKFSFTDPARGKLQRPNIDTVVKPAGLMPQISNVVFLPEAPNIHFIVKEVSFDFANPEFPLCVLLDYKDKISQ